MVFVTEHHYTAQGLIYYMAWGPKQFLPDWCLYRAGHLILTRGCDEHDWSMKQGNHQCCLVWDVFFQKGLSRRFWLESEPRKSHKIPASMASRMRDCEGTIRQSSLWRYCRLTTETRGCTLAMTSQDRKPHTKSEPEQKVSQNRYFSSAIRIRHSFTFRHIPLMIAYGVKL